MAGARPSSWVPRTTGDHGGRRALALAALLGPALVVGLATTLDHAGVLALEGLVRSVVALVAVALALGVFTPATGRRRTAPPSRHPRRRDTVS